MSRLRRVSGPKALYDLSAVLVVGLILVLGFFWGGDPDDAQRRRQSFVRGVDNVLGGAGQPELVLQYGGIDDDPEINGHVQEVFERLVPEAMELRSDLRYRVSVLKSKIPNAFSLPGGRTFITRGLLELFDDDDQLAGVLGHELAHTIRSHGSQAFGRDLGMILLYDFLLDKLPEHQRQAAAELGQLSVALISTGYSRQAETEADELGLYLAVAGGYRPLGLAEALQKIEEYQKEQIRSGRGPSQQVPEFFRTHPLTEDRIRHISQLANEMGFDVYVPGDSVTEALRRFHRNRELEHDWDEVLEEID